MQFVGMCVSDGRLSQYGDKPPEIRVEIKERTAGLVNMVLKDLPDTALPRSGDLLVGEVRYVRALQGKRGAFALVVADVWHVQGRYELVANGHGSAAVDDLQVGVVLAAESTKK